MDFRSSALVPALYLVLAIAVIGVACVAFVMYRPEPSERVTERLATITNHDTDPRLTRPAVNANDSSLTSESYAKAVQRVLDLEELLDKRTKLLEKKSTLLDRREADYRELRKEVDEYSLLLSQIAVTPKTTDSEVATQDESPKPEDVLALHAQLKQLKTKLSENETAERQMEFELNQVKEDLSSAYAEIAEQRLAAAFVTRDNAVADASTRLLLSLGANVVPSIADLLSDRRAEVRVWAADTLGRFGRRAEDAVPQLREALMDRDPQVRAAAERSIDAILD